MLSDVFSTSVINKSKLAAVNKIGCKYRLPFTAGEQNRIKYTDYSAKFSMKGHLLQPTVKEIQSPSYFIFILT